MADLGPGTMPRGKYPESPAPAGSHALISRTPTPGGMLHANLGLPRPPPRNFQPSLPQRLPVQPQKNPPNKKPPRAVTLGACASDHSRGQTLLLQRLPVQPQKNPPNKNLLVPPPPADWGEGLIRCAGRPQEWSFGAVPPREWMARGGWFLFPRAAAPAAARGIKGLGVAPASGRMLPEWGLAGGPASHACRRGSGSTRN